MPAIAAPTVNAHDQRGPVVTTVAGAGGAVEPAVIVHGADAKQRGVLDDALARFEAAGLALPELEIFFSDDASACAGHLGAFRDRAERRHISVCSDLEFVVVHELAHAWSDANLDEVARNRYVRARELATWSDHGVPWAQRGTEDAAFIIQQNLRDVAPSVLASATWVERITAFELLTGTPSPLQGRRATERVARAPITYVDQPTPKQRATIEWAIGRFADAGLELPDLRVSFPAFCEGKGGLYRGDGEIEFCRVSDRLVLHELAHAWDDTSGDIDRAAFLELRGVDVWFGGLQIPSADQGAEHLAIIVAWGLMDASARSAHGLPHNSDSELTAAFRLLTGNAPHRVSSGSDQRRELLTQTRLQ